MENGIDRRRFLKAACALGAGVGLAGGNARRLLAAEAPKGAPNAAKLGWRLGCAAYSFNALTFHETIAKVAALGLDAVEGFTWQALSKEKPKVQTNPSMSADDRKETKARLADAGVKLLSIYCQALDKEDACRRTFEFAKEMGIETLVGEPPFAAYDLIEKLCDEFQINLAVHNHPQPSQYWNPETLLKLCQGRSKRIGACCDTGHWVRSGIGPVEALKKLEGRIISFHLKDVSEAGRKDAPCVPWGTGKGEIKPILAEVRRQGFKGFFPVEYEPYSPDNPAKIAQCIEYFDKVAAELA